MPKTPSKPTKKTRKPAAKKPARKRPAGRPAKGVRKKSGGSSAKPRVPAPRTSPPRAIRRAGLTRKPKIAVVPPGHQVAVAELLAPAAPARDESLETVMIAVEAAREKQARNMLLLDLRSMADFTDFFFICSGTNPRQVQAICDEIDIKMKQAGLRTTHTEGYNHAEWVLLDYVDFVAHVFTEQAREYYDLERLWKSADRVPLGEQEG